MSQILVDIIQINTIIAARLPPEVNMAVWGTSVAFIAIAVIPGALFAAAILFLAVVSFVKMLF